MSKSNLISFHPFANDADAVSIGEFDIENHTDAISVSGSIDITRDKQGLKHALQLQEWFASMVAVLKADPDLPETVDIQKASVTTAPPPFG